MDDRLKELIFSHAVKEFPSSFEVVKCGDNNFQDRKEYSENVSPDAIDDSWLDNETSFIWKVATLALIDWNKCDHVNVILGLHRGPDHEPEIIGTLNFSDGENHDIGRVIDRMIMCLRLGHPVFDNDSEEE